MALTPQIYSVGQFLDLINLQLADFPAALQGEITSLSQRKHAYFTLSDSETDVPAVINCALWQSRLSNLPFELKEGLEVQLLGHANVYKPTGRLSFIVEHIAPVGEGALRQAFELLKSQLEAKGYFELERKRSLPEFPTRIGLLTSADGDALRDFKQHLGQFGLQIVHKDARVEGLNAIPSLVEGIEWFNQHPEVLPGGVEVLVITRGGGSLESLQAFNSEAVARAIFASKIPVISAVGHERDITIADLVADIRASTPTDAGRILSEQWRLAESRMEQQVQLIKQGYQQILTQQFDNLKNLWANLSAGFFNKNREFLTKAQQLFTLANIKFGNVLDLTNQSFNFLKLQIQTASPENRLKQGYSVVSNQRGQVIKSQQSVKKGELLRIQLYQGKLAAKVADE